MGGKNRIVVDYGDYEGLVLLSAFDTKTGIEESRKNLEKLNGFELVKRYDNVKDYSLLKNKVKDNQEGFVLKFSNGLRVKIKGEEYIRLHKIISEISTKSIWKCLSNGDNIYKLVQDLPDEYFERIKDYAEDLKRRYVNIERTALRYYNELTQGKSVINRREFAKEATKSKLSPILFKMLDGKDYSSIIWERLKPKYEKQ